MDDKKKKKHLLFSFIICIIVLNLWIISFILSTIRYCLYTYKIKKLEEHDPFIDLSGVQSLSFSKTTSNNPEYNSVVPNLGYTGELSFDCYKGLYFYLAPDECYPEECGDNKCPQKNKTCLSY